MDTDLLTIGSPRELYVPPNTPVALYDVNRVFAFEDYPELVPSAGQKHVYLYESSDLHQDEWPCTRSTPPSRPAVYGHSNMNVAPFSTSGDWRKMEKVRVENASPIDEFRRNVFELNRSTEEIDRLAEFLCIETCTDMDVRKTASVGRTLPFARVYPTINSVCKICEFGRSQDEIEKIVALFCVENKKVDTVMGPFNMECTFADLKARQGNTMVEIGTLHRESLEQTSAIRNRVKERGKRLKSSKVRPDVSTIVTLKKMSEEKKQEVAAMFCVESTADAAVRKIKHGLSSTTDDNQACLGNEYDNRCNLPKQESVKLDGDLNGESSTMHTGKTDHELESRRKRKTLWSSLRNLFQSLKQSVSRK